MKRILSILVSTSALFLSLVSFGQDDCKNALYEANVLFEAGKLQAAIDRLEFCVNNKMSWEERFESNRLLALAYQNLNDEEYAEIYILKMLRMKPDYQKLPNNDPPDFTRLVEQFDVERRLEIGIKMGMNFNKPKLLQSYSLFQTPQKYQMAPGFSLGICADHYFNSRWHLRGGFLYKGTAIQHLITDEAGWEKSYTDDLRLWELNFAPRYFIAIENKLLPFIGVSLGMAKMTNSRIIMETRQSSGQIEYNSQNGLSFKNTLQPNIGVLLGFSLPLDRSTVDFELGYSWGLVKVSKEDRRFDNPEFIFNAQYVADDIRMRLLEVSVTYSLPQAYRIRKR